MCSEVVRRPVVGDEHRTGRLSDHDRLSLAEVLVRGVAAVQTRAKTQSLDDISLDRVSQPGEVQHGLALVMAHQQPRAVLHLSPNLLTPPRHARTPMDLGEERQRASDGEVLQRDGVVEVQGRRRRSNSTGEPDDERVVLHGVIDAVEEVVRIVRGTHLAREDVRDVLH